MNRNNPWILFITIFLSASALAQTETQESFPPIFNKTKANNFYYFCKSTKSYYPSVMTCPEPWVTVPMAPPLSSEAVEQKDTPSTSYLNPEESVTLHPNTASLEFFGKALLFSLNYDRAVSSHVNLGLGISTWDAAQRWWNYQATIIVMPIYANYYFTENHSRGFLTTGVDLIHVSQSGYVNDSFENSGAAVILGGGYEYRDHTGFLFRLAGYFIMGRSTTLNPSVSLGMAF